MQSLLDATAAAPKEAIALLTALIAATVALVVAIFTQLVLSRRETTRLLAQKLEDLYLCSVKWQKDTDDLHTQLEWFSRAGRMDSDELRALVEKLALQQSVESIAMYIELYFPPLRRFSKQCWEAHREYEVLLRRITQSGHATPIEIRAAALRVQQVLTQLRSEIPLNREYLTRSRPLGPRYRETRL